MSSASSNQRLVVQSRQRIALSRRLLNPGWALEGGSGDRDLSGATKLWVLSEEPMLLGVEREISGPGASVFPCFGSYLAWWEENVRGAGRSRRRSQKQRALIQWSPTPVQPDPLRLTLITEPLAGSSIRRTSAPPGSASASEGAKRRPEEVDGPGSTIRSDGLGSASLPCALLLSSLDLESLPTGAAMTRRLEASNRKRCASHGVTNPGSQTGRPSANRAVWKGAIHKS